MNKDDVKLFFRPLTWGFFSGRSRSWAAWIAILSAFGFDYFGKYRDIALVVGIFSLIYMIVAVWMNDYPEPGPPSNAAFTANQQREIDTSYEQLKQKIQGMRQ